MVSAKVAEVRFHLTADISTDSPDKIGPMLGRLVGGTITRTPEGFRVEASTRGTDPRELNRELLSAMRRLERRTRLRAEWTGNGMTHRFFDYVPKGTRPAPNQGAPPIES